VTHPAIAADVYQAPDVRVHLAAQITLYRLFSVDDFSNASQVQFGESADSRVPQYSGLFSDVLGLGRTDAEYPG
jgi:hypothetical protein